MHRQPHTEPELQVLTVRATREQMARVRELLATHEGTGAPACATAPGGDAR